METTNAVIAVCDDECEIRHSIERNIRLVYPDVRIVSFDSAEALSEYAENTDIIFLDIQMDGVSGMEAARNLRKRGSRAVIIFVTAIEEYVYDAFEVGAFRYLVKPIDRVKFFEVLRAAVDEYDSRKAADDRQEPFLAVKTGNTTRRIYLYEILYLEVFNRKVIVHRADDEIEFYGKLVELENRLSDDFVRCHRSYIVNLRYIQAYDSSSLTLENGEMIPLPQQKYAEFVRRYLKYTKKLIGDSHAR